MKRAYSRSGLAIIALYGILSIVSGIVIGGIAGVMVGIIMSQEMLFGGDFTLSSIQRVLEMLQDGSFTDLILLGSAIGSAAGMGLGILIIRKILPREVVPIERRDLTTKELAVVVFSAFGLWALGAFIGNLPSFFGVYSMSFESESKIATLLFCVYAVIGAPILEELVFRKLLLDRIHPYGQTVAALVSALLFGLFHGNAAQFPLAFLVGFISATVYMKTGRIFYSILLHFMINLTGTLTELFGLFGIDISIGWNIAVAGLMVAGVIVYLICRKKEILTLKKPTVPDANAQAFRNVGMRIAVIGGLVLMIGTELLLLFMSVSEGDGWLSLIRLIPCAVSVVTVFIVMNRAGRSYEKLPEPEPGPEVLSSESNDGF